MSVWRTAACAGLLLVGAAASVRAQAPTGGPAKPRAMELGIGGMWTGAEAFGTTDFVETTPSAAPFVLFTTTNRLQPAFGATLSLGRRIGRRVLIEANGGAGRVQLESRASNDFEGAAPVTATAPAWQFTAGGALSWTVIRRGRSEIFLDGGAGWMRQLTSDRLLFVDGAIGTLGGGVKYWWRERPGARPLGLRIDAQAVGRTGALSLGARGLRLSPAVGAALVMRF